MVFDEEKTKPFIFLFKILFSGTAEWSIINEMRYYLLQPQLAQLHHSLGKAIQYYSTDCYGKRFDYGLALLSLTFESRRVLVR